MTDTDDVLKFYHSIENDNIYLIFDKKDETFQGKPYIYKNNRIRLKFKI